MRVLFALCISANRLLDNATLVESRAAACLASSSEEAEGVGIRLARDAYPVSDGWYAHAAASCPIPLEMASEYVEGLE